MSLLKIIACLSFILSVWTEPVFILVAERYGPDVLKQVRCQEKLSRFPLTTVERNRGFLSGFASYKRGFGGSLNYEFWQGNGKLYSLTTQRYYQILIDLINRDGAPYYAKFRSFRINSEDYNYRLSTLGSYSGSADTTMHPPAFRQVLVVASVLVSLISASRWETDNQWCLFGPSIGQLYQGDFNGDGQTDLLCHRTTDGYKWIVLANECSQFTGNSWGKALGWCFQGGAEIHIGDFNGDGRSDMLCHNTVDGRKWIIYANSAGNFDDANTWTQNVGWCKHEGSQLFIGDFNGDGKDDMLCHDSTGAKWIAYATPVGGFGGAYWEGTQKWCASPAQLLIGDFNGDGKDDMLCHRVDDGYKWILYSNSAGNFAGGTGWGKDMGWCFQSGASVHIADVNGDGKDDMVCHDNAGYKHLALANVDGNFCGGTTWKSRFRWCYDPDGQFLLGDYNGDNNADMLCHDMADGKKWIIYSNPNIYE